MIVKEKAKEFAIKAHVGQIRKSDPIKPMIIHPINVGNILEEYGFDDNVVAAGYLHDVVEDTKYTQEDIKKEFGDDIASLVCGASEPDKSLSWEERKTHTINEIKNLDIRHKAVVCADKISNLEDLRILFETKGEYDFSAFKRGFDSQKWYYTGVYESLIYNENSELPMFVKLKELVYHIYHDEKQEFSALPFLDAADYERLKKLHYKKEEVYKLKNVLGETKPFVIEFTGTPRTGKTGLINNFYDFFTKKGFSVSVIDEFTTSKRYKEEIYPTIKDEPKNVLNEEIMKHVVEELKQVKELNSDIILADRSIFDRLIWFDRLYNNCGLTKEEYLTSLTNYLPLVKENINLVVATYVSSDEALERDYKEYLALEERRFLSEDNILSYNRALLDVLSIASNNDVNVKFIDTGEFNKRQVSILAADCILEDMKKTYAKKAWDKFK